VWDWSLWNMEAGCCWEGAVRGGGDVGIGWCRYVDDRVKWG